MKPMTVVSSANFRMLTNTSLGLHLLMLRQKVYDHLTDGNWYTELDEFGVEDFRIHGEEQDAAG